MDSVVVFCFLALVQLSQATSPIFKPLHDDYKVQLPIAQRSFLNPSSFFRDSAIKKSFENYSPNINEPQLSHRRNGRNLGGTLLETDISINKGILTNNNEGQKFSSHQTEQNYESNIQQRLLRNKQDLKENSLGHESHSLLSTNQKSKEISESQKKSEQLNNVVSDLKINEKSSILAAKVDVDNKELSTTINAPNIQQVIKQQILPNHIESETSLTENKNQRVTSNVESIQSSMSLRNTENNEHSENQQSYLSQSQKQSFTRQDQNSRSLINNMKSYNDMNKIYESTSSGTNDNYLLVPNLKDVFTDEQNEQQNNNENIMETEEKENQSESAIEKQDANKSNVTNDSEDEFWENEDTYIDDYTTELNEPTKLGSQNQPTVPPINDQSSIKLSQDQPSLQPKQLNQNQPPLQPAEDQPSTQLDRVEAPVQSSQNQLSLILDKDTQPNQNEHTLNDSDQLLLKPDLDKQSPLKQDSEQTPTQPDQDQLLLQTSQEQNHIPSQPDQKQQLLFNSHKDQPTLTSNQDQPSSQPDQGIMSQKPELKQSISEEYQSQVTELQSSLQPDEDELLLRTDRSQPQSIPDKTKLYSEPERDISKNLNKFILPDLNKSSKPLTNHKHSISVIKQSERNNQTHISSQTSKNLKKTNSELEKIKATQPYENQLMQEELPTQLATVRVFPILSEEQHPNDIPTIVELDKNEPSIQTGQDQPLQQKGQAKSLPQDRQDQPVVQPGQDSSLLQLEHDQPERLIRRDEPLTQSRKDNFLRQTEQDEPIIPSSQDQQLTQSMSEPGHLTAVPNQDQPFLQSNPVQFPKIFDQDQFVLRPSKDEKSKKLYEIQYSSQNSEYGNSMAPNQHKTHAQPNQPTEIGHVEPKEHQNQPQINQENVFAQKNLHTPSTNSKQDQSALNDQTNKKIHDQKIWTQASESTYQHSQSTKQTEQSQIISDQTPTKETRQEQPNKQKDQDLLTAPSGQNEHMIQPMNNHKYTLNKPRYELPTGKSNQDIPSDKFSKDEASSKFGLHKRLAIYQGKPAITHDIHKPTSVTEQDEPETNTDQPIIMHDQKNPEHKTDQGKPVSLTEDKLVTKSDKSLTLSDQNKITTHFINDISTNKAKQDQTIPHVLKSELNQAQGEPLKLSGQDKDFIDCEDITRSSRSRSETDSTSQRRGRYDLSRSSGRQDVQQAIETEVNYKTLIVGDGSKNGKCYCSCDINSKPVFISLDRLEGLP